MEYLIEPGKPQEISAQLWDESGKPVDSDISGRKVYLTPGSATAQISSALKTPSYYPPGATVPVTINKGTTQRGFLYKDPVLGSSTLTATSSGLSTGFLKITIGFPPPPPPPAPKPAAKPVVSKTFINSNQPIIEPVAVAQVLPEQVIEIKSEEISVDDILSNIQPDPAVLSVETEQPFSLFWEIINYLRKLLFAKIML